MTELLDERQLFELTKHENPVIRVYAFKGLLEKESKFLDKANKILEKDSTEFRHGGGCIIGIYKVSEYIEHPKYFEFPE